MFEVLIFAAGAATGALAVALPYHRAVRDRDVLQAAKDSLAVDVEALSNRVTTLRGDNIALEADMKALTDGHSALVAERDGLKRQIGRLEAERRAAQPKRGEGGRFVAKPKAEKQPVAAAFKKKAPKATPPKPVACG